LDARQKLAVSYIKLGRIEAGREQARQIKALQQAQGSEETPEENKFGS
jgi:hypothetical protein